MNGLLFMDGTGKFYSTNFGQILKYLDFKIVAGQATPPEKVFLKNSLGCPVKNIRLFVRNRDLDDSVVWVEISRENAPFTSEGALLYGSVLNNQESISFYVRIVSDRKAKAGGMFDIFVTAEPLEAGQ